MLGTLFPETDLSNSNFEGVSLFEDKVLGLLGKNMAHLVDKPLPELVELITGLPPQQNKLFPYQKQIDGNDLILHFIFVNNFSNANLQNVNFSNADLRLVSFQNANLSHANLSGADLTGADLTGVLLDTAILDCKNHSICE